MEILGYPTIEGCAAPFVRVHIYSELRVRHLLRVGLLLVSFGIATIGYLPSSSNAQTVDTSKIAAIFAASPGGGKALVVAIAEAAQGDPGNAQLIIQFALNGTPEQQFAAATGLRQAYEIALSNGNAETAAAIQLSASAAGGAFAVAYAAAAGAASTIGGDARVTLAATTPSSSSTTGVPVSPARP
jgi:hypothetical protein